MHCWICSPIRLQNWHAITTRWHSVRTLDLVICQNLLTFFCVVVKIQKDFEKQLKHLADTQLGNWATLNWTVKFDSLIHKDLRDNCILTVQNGRPRDRLRKSSPKTGDCLFTQSHVVPPYLVMRLPVQRARPELSLVWPARLSQVGRIGRVTLARILLLVAYMSVSWWT